MTWMAWTLPTALFFVCIGCALVGLTVWELRSPTVERKGFLPISTTRGDRFFIGLLFTGFAHLAWLALTDLPIPIVSALALMGLVGIMRWG